MAEANEEVNWTKNNDYSEGNSSSSRGRRGGRRRVQRPLMMAEHSAAAVTNTTTTRKRPTHFFAVQISDCEIVESARSVQSVMVEREKLLETALVHESTFHITLAVVHLSSPQEHVEAGRVLMEAGNELCKQLADVEGFTLRFGQLGHFDGAVIFAGLHPEEKEGGNHLTQLSACLMDGCRAANIHLIDDRFHPHVTLLKLSKDPQLRRQGIKKVAPSLYESHSECITGTQVVKSIQLLSMTEPKDPSTGYYALKGEFHFASSSSSSSSTTFTSSLP